MLAKVLSFGLLGIEGYPVEIEVDISRGLPGLALVGLADAAIRESKERVKSAIKNSGFRWPAERVTISLAPSYIKKEGASFDLAIAMGVLAATSQLDPRSLNEYYILGELSLDGALRPARGILPITMAAAKSSIKNMILPLQNAKEAGFVEEASIWPVKSLREAVEFLNDPQRYKPFRTETGEIFRGNQAQQLDFSEVKGQYHAKRALEVAVSGGHNVLMVGPPGSGKSMLAKRIATIMPDLNLNEALEVTKIHSAMGKLSANEGIIGNRPFRAPHHTISNVALVGGGSLPVPGEISLSHQGVLFLDELPEFRRDSLEALRQPLEDGFIRVCRIHHSFLFPASFMLVCAMNPCPCGYYTDAHKACKCSPGKIASYMGKVSGPLLDRIDIQIEVPAARYRELSSSLPAENSGCIKERIERARSIQRERLKDENILYNARMGHKQVRRFCALGEDEDDLLRAAMSELDLSARAYDKILKLSRTIADLAGSAKIKTEHLSEAIQYRSLDRRYL